MRLWHVDLIEYLPRQQLLGQHRECCALRGKGWGRPHATINYIFQYHPRMLYQYHLLVMNEMKRRGYQVDEHWLDDRYRGKLLGYADYHNFCEKVFEKYPEHNQKYFAECIDNLKNKGIILFKE